MIQPTLSDIMNLMCTIYIIQFVVLLVIVDAIADLRKRIG